MQNDQETTEQGLLQALLAGDISTDEFLQMSDQGQEPGQTESGLNELGLQPEPTGALGPQQAQQTYSAYLQAKRSYDEVRARELWRDLQGYIAQYGLDPRQFPEQPSRQVPARGVQAGPRRPGAGALGQGPRGVPSGIKPEPAMAGGSFESLVSEACRMRPKKKTKKSKQKESLEEFGAPEFREVAMWARGHEVKRNSETQPYYFQEDKMFSRRVQIAVRDLDEKKARVLSPKVLDAYSGRHSVLAQHGLKSCGFQVEVVESLDS